LSVGKEIGLPRIQALLLPGVQSGRRSDGNTLGEKLLMTEIPALSAPCPRCGQPMSSAKVKTMIWQADQLYVVEDIPAQICNSCLEQYYDEDVTDALRQLTEDKFPAAERTHEMLVPFYSLEGRIRKRTAPLDYEQY
jgi:YgiT-type zinc finger domain-containing protein